MSKNAEWSESGASITVESSGSDVDPLALGTTLAERALRELREP